MEEELVIFNTIVSSHMYPENPEGGTQLFVGSKNMGYISDTAKESNSQPVPSQVQADPTRPPWRPYIFKLRI